MPESPSKPPLNVNTNAFTFLFMVILSFVCATILSLLASALSKPQEIAKDLDRSKEMMKAARIIGYKGNFQLVEKQHITPAKYEQGGILIPTQEIVLPSHNDILDVYNLRLKPFLVDAQGNTTTFEKAQIDMQKYLTDYKKTGYYKEPLKLMYKILPNPQNATEIKDLENKPPVGYVIPVNGFGLWGPIYGYLAIEPDGNTIIGISWYEHIETPGLGAGIGEEYWQTQFPGKRIFQASPDGKTDFMSAPIGIVVVRGKVNEVLGDSPKALSAVDGMAGATLTGNGVTQAYRDVFTAYKPFLQKIHDQHVKSKK